MSEVVVPGGSAQLSAGNYTISVPASIVTSTTNLYPVLSNWQPVNGTGLTLDYTTVHTAGQPSIKIPAGTTGTSRNLFELNNLWTAVNAGDIVSFSAYVKVDAAATYGQGVLIGVDCYGAYERIIEVHARTEAWVFTNPNPSLETQAGSPQWVAFGEDWTHVTYNFTVPSLLYTHEDNSLPLTYGSQYVVGFIPWMSLYWRLLSGGGYAPTAVSPANCWFADVELYINP